MFKTKKKIEELEGEINELKQYNIALTERVLKLVDIVKDLSDRVLVNTEAIFGNDDE